MDERQPRSSSEDEAWVGVEARTLFDEMMDAQRIRTRYTVWPSRTRREHEIPGLRHLGMDEALSILNWWFRENR